MISYPFACPPVGHESIPGSINRIEFAAIFSHDPNADQFDWIARSALAKFSIYEIFHLRSPPSYRPALGKPPRDNRRISGSRNPLPGACSHNRPHDHHSKHLGGRHTRRWYGWPSQATSTNSYVIPTIPQWMLPKWERSISCISDIRMLWYSTSNLWPVRVVFFCMVFIFVSSMLLASTLFYWYKYVTLRKQNHKRKLFKLINHIDMYG